MTLIIDCHGHYTTAPPQHDAWRDAQKAAFKDGNKAYKEERFREAIERYTRALELQPDMPEALFYLGSGVAAAFTYSALASGGIFAVTALIMLLMGLLMGGVRGLFSGAVLLAPAYVFLRAPVPPLSAQFGVVPK
mgnify:CR=1 FL=1